MSTAQIDVIYCNEWDLCPSSCQVATLLVSKVMVQLEDE